MEGLPITLLELVQLTDVGVDPSSISWTNLTLNSDKWVCVRQTHEGSNHIFIVDLDDPAKLQRHKITAESAIMHLDQPIIALQGAGVLQVFNLATKMKLASIATEDQILFWKWISSTTLAYITDKAVYHWHVLDDKQSPTKVFDRDQQLAEMQIVNYLVTDHNAASKNWYCLVGLTAKDGKIIGASQLYSEEKKAGQITPAFAAAFASYDKNASLLVFVVKNGELYYLHVIPVGQPETRPTFVRQAREIYFPPETAGVDWPIAIQVSEKYKVIYLLTKFGYFHLFDLETAKLIFMNRISADSILYTAPRKKDDGGMVCLNKKGQVLAVNVNDKEIVSFLATQLNDVELSKEFLNRNAHTLPAQVISEIKAGLQKQLDQLLVEKRFFEAATLASASPDLRTLETVEKFKAQPAEPTQPPVLMQYLSILLQRGKLNKFESIEAVKMALGMYKTDMIGMWLKDDKLDCTEELGDLLFSTDKKMAMSAYYRAEAKDKVIKCFIETGDFEKLLAYAQKCNYWPDLTNTFVDIVDTNQSQALVMATSILSKNDRLLDPKRVVDILDRKHCVQEITTLLLAILKNTPEERDLQTRLLEVNLKAGSLGVQVANGILEKGVFTYFDKRKIADLCDQVGLKDRAMQLKAKHAKDALFEEELQKLVEVFKSGFISQNDFDRRKKEIEKKHGK